MDELKPCEHEMLLVGDFEPADPWPPARNIRAWGCTRCGYVRLMVIDATPWRCDFCGFVARSRHQDRCPACGTPPDIPF